MNNEKKTCLKRMRHYVTSVSIGGLVLIVVSMILGEIFPINIVIPNSVILFVAAFSYYHLRFKNWVGYYMFIIYGISPLIIMLLYYSTTLNIPQKMFSFYLEIGIILLSALMVDLRKNIWYHIKNKYPIFYNKNLLFMAFTSGNAVLLLVLCLPHFIITLGVLVFSHNPSPTLIKILLHILPITLISIVVLVNIVLAKVLVEVGSDKEKMKKFCK